MDEKKKLEEDLTDYDNVNLHRTMFTNAVEFILADRRRIVEPLLNLGQIKKQPLPPYEHLCQAIEETIERAGLK